jgi:hypothetical protein
MTRQTPKNDQTGFPPRLWLSIKNGNKLITFYRKTTKNDRKVPPDEEILPK